MNHIICAPVFSDHMVLQQNKPIRIFGHARWGISITASLLPEKDEGTEATGSDFSPAATASVTVSPENLPKDMTFAPYPDAPADHIRFCVTLPPIKAGGPYRLSVLGQAGQKEGDDTVACEIIEFHDVMIGEVWLAGGQSNMEYALEADRDFERIKNAPSSRVRFYNVGRRFFIDENFYEEERKDHWMCTDENLGTWSAVGYYFAEKIAEETGVCVGIIGCNLGGTSASAWQNKESLLSCEKTRSYWEEYEEILSTLDPDIYEKERLDYIEYHSKWQPKSDEYYRTHPDATWEEMQGYGYQFWMTTHNGYACYGMGGQYACYYPEKNILFITTADTQGRQGGTQLIYDAFYQEIYDRIGENVSCTDTSPSLEKFLSSRTLFHIDGQYTSPLLHQINHVRYRMDSNSNGFRWISLSLDENEGTFDYETDKGVFSLPFGIGYNEIIQYPFYHYKAAVSGAFRRDDTFLIKAHLVDECVGNVFIQLVFKNRDITLMMRKFEETMFNEFEGFISGHAE